MFDLWLIDNVHLVDELWGKAETVEYFGFLQAADLRILKLSIKQIPYYPTNFDPYLVGQTVK